MGVVAHCRAHVTRLTIKASAVCSSAQQSPLDHQAGTPGAGDQGHRRGTDSTADAVVCWLAERGGGCRLRGSVRRQAFSPVRWIAGSSSCVADAPVGAAGGQWVSGYDAAAYKPGARSATTKTRAIRSCSAGMAQRGPWRRPTHRVARRARCRLCRAGRQSGALPSAQRRTPTSRHCPRRGTGRDGRSSQRHRRARLEQIDRTLSARYRRRQNHQHPGRTREREVGPPRRRLSQRSSSSRLP
jgi:hypothetical protein